MSRLLLAASLVIAVLAPKHTQAQDYSESKVVIGAGYFQENEKAKSGIEEEFKKLELRLRELENDVQKKLESAPEQSEENEEAHEDFDSRIEELEEAVEDQSDSISDLEDYDKRIIVPGVSKVSKMKFFGRIHLDYWAFPDHDAAIETFEGGDPQDRFNFRRLRIGTQGDLTSNVFYKYEGEFAGGINPSYRDAYIGVRDLPYLNTLILGNQKRPYGLDHLNSSKTNVFIERPFIVEAFNQDSRRLGIASYGISEDLKYNWRYGVFNQRLTQTGSGYVGDHYQLEVAGRLAATPWYDESSGGRGWLHLAVSGSLGYPDGLGGNANEARYRTRPEARSNNRWVDTGRIAGADESMLGGLEAALNVGAWHFTAEYMGLNIERSAGFGPSLQLHGGYIYAAYMLTGEHESWDRKKGTIGRVKPFENFFAVRDCDCNVKRGIGAWQVAARYSYADFNDADLAGGKGTSLTLGLNWWWNENTRWQMNYITGEVNNPLVGVGDYQIVGLRFMVDF